jgi:hypothetical protein
MPGGSEVSPKQIAKVRAFFSGTAATVRMLNAWKGRRHLTLGLDCIEMLVLACVPHRGELSFDEFVTEWLYRRCGIVVGRQAASAANLLGSLDAAIFEANEARLATQMRTIGLLTEYSDATRMVRTGELH